MFTRTFTTETIYRRRRRRQRPKKNYLKKKNPPTPPKTVFGRFSFRTRTVATGFRTNIFCTGRAHKLAFRPGRKENVTTRGENGPVHFHRVVTVPSELGARLRRCIFCAYRVIDLRKTTVGFRATGVRVWAPSVCYLGNSLQAYCIRGKYNLG